MEAAAIIEAHNSGMQWAELPLMRDLAEKIDNARQFLNCEAILCCYEYDLLVTQGVFVRTSSRSPKDAALGNRGLGIYKSTLERLHMSQHSTLDPLNTTVI